VDPEDLVDLFDVAEVDDDLPAASWNVAPTDLVPVVLERLRDDVVVRRLRPLHWGLVPSWSKDTGGGARMINARSETLAEKPAFRKALAARRCLLPADGYYEWYETGARTAKGKPVKQPYFIRRADGEPLAMAGLYEFWKDPAFEGDEAPTGGPRSPWYLSCTVITTAAEDALGTIHERMPMIIGADDWGAWLDPRATDTAAAIELLHVTEPGLLLPYPVSTEVNSVRNNGPQLVEPAEPVEDTGA